jgi:hypothetical protein
MGADITAFDIEAQFASDGPAPGPLAPLSTQSVSVDCGCNTIPMTITLTHDIFRDNDLSDFFQRNGYATPSVISMRYDGASWRNNFQYMGTGNDGTTERWNAVFEWSCTDQINGDTLPVPEWRFAVLIRRTGVDAGRNEITRLLYTFGQSPDCEDDEFSFLFTIDTMSGLVTPPSRIVPDVMILADNLGLFQSQGWINDPTLSLSLQPPSNLVPYTLLSLSPALTSV